MTAELVEIGKPRGAAEPLSEPRAPASAPAIPPLTGQSLPNVSTHSGTFQALSKGDEKRSLQILCTKVKQEAEAAAAAPGDATIDRPYRTALQELDRGTRTRGRARPDPDARRDHREAPGAGGRARVPREDESPSLT